MFSYDSSATSGYLNCDAYTSAELGFGSYVEGLGVNPSFVDDIQFDCIPFIFGCTDSTASNYNSNANSDDGTCVYGDETVVFRITSFTADTNEIHQADWPLGDNDEYNTGANNQPDYWNEDDEDWNSEEILDQGEPTI